MIEASREERRNANKKIRKYKKEIEKVMYTKSDRALFNIAKIPAIALYAFPISYIAFGNLFLGLLGVCLATMPIIIISKTKLAMDKSRYKFLSEEEQKKYDEIIEEAKTLSKVNNSKKVKRFIKTYEVKKPYYSVEDVKALLVASEFYKEKNLFTNQQEIEKTISSERIDDKEENLKINLTRAELEQLLNGETILLQEPIEIKMKEDIYSSLTKDDNALKDNSRKNRQKVKSRFNKN